MRLLSLNGLKVESHMKMTRQLAENVLNATMENRGMDDNFKVQVDRNRVMLLGPGCSRSYPFKYAGAKTEEEFIDRCDELLDKMERDGLTANIK